MTESANIISRGRGRGNPRCRGGRGGGRGGPRGGRISSSSARGGRSNTKNTHNKQQQQTKQNHKGGRGGGGGRGNRPRSSSYNKSDGASTVKEKRTGPYAHLFCSERHGFALSRVFYPRNNDQFLLPTNIKEENNNSNNTRIASDSQMENWWEAVKLVRCHVPHNETTDSNDRCPICLDEEMVWYVNVCIIIICKFIRY